MTCLALVKGEELVDRVEMGKALDDMGDKMTGEKECLRGRTGECVGGSM